MVLRTSYRPGGGGGCPLPVTLCNTTPRFPASSLVLVLDPSRVPLLAEALDAWLHGT